MLMFVDEEQLRGRRSQHVIQDTHQEPQLWQADQGSEVRVQVNSGGGEGNQ